MHRPPSRPTAHPVPNHIAVIDIGKTNAKVVLVEGRSREQLKTLSRANKVRQDGMYPHADVEALWDFLIEGLASLNAAHGIDGISITTHGATAVLLDARGLALPVLDYEYEGPQSCHDQYDAVRPAFSESLSPRLPNGLNLGAQLFWQAQNFAERFATVTDILAYPQYWAWRLTGIRASEVTSLGCHTDLWAPDSNDFSSLVARQDWRGFFPPIHPAAAILGPVLPDIAEKIGLAAPTPVTCGIHDSNASLLPHLGQAQTPFTILSTGTWAIAMTVGGETTGLDQARDSLANVDAFGRPVPTARFMAGREFDLLVPRMVPPEPADIDRVIAQDIQALPSFVAGVGPFGAGAGRWTHDPETLPPAERTAAASLYLALMARQCIELCGRGRSITIEGPLARNALFGAALARLTGVPVRASADSTGTSLGASLLFGGTPEAPDTEAALPPLSHAGFLAYAQRWQDRADTV